MTKYCNDCHTANKDRARYCCLCKGRFSGVRFSAHLSASTFPDSLSLQHEALRAPPGPRSRRGRSASARISLLLIFMLLLLAPSIPEELRRSPAEWSLVRNSVATTAVAAPGGEAVVPAAAGCAEARAALALCPEQPSAKR